MHAAPSYKRHDIRGFVAGGRELGVTPHVAQSLKCSGGSAIDGSKTRHRGDRVSQRLRKRIEEIFGWSKDCVFRSNVPTRSGPRAHRSGRHRKWARSAQNHWSRSFGMGTLDRNAHHSFGADIAQHEPHRDDDRNCHAHVL